MTLPIRVALKPDVSLVGLCVQMSISLPIVCSVYARRGYDVTVTSGTEGKHGRASKHYIGQALDFRVRHVPGPVRRAIHAEVADSLGADFDVVLKWGRGPHLHVEWDPKGPINP